MSDGNKRRRGHGSLYLHGGTNSLMRALAGRRENLEQIGAWSREQLLRMDDRFVVAVEAAFRSGLVGERR